LNEIRVAIAAGCVSDCTLLGFHACVNMSHKRRRASDRDRSIDEYMAEMAQLERGTDADRERAELMEATRKFLASSGAFHLCYTFWWNSDRAWRWLKHSKAMRAQCIACRFASEGVHMAYVLVHAKVQYHGQLDSAVECRHHPGRVKECAKRHCSSNVTEQAEWDFLDRYKCNAYAVDHANEPDICFWPCTFLDKEEDVKNANYSILGSIPIGGNDSAVWFDTTLVHTDMSAEEFKETIETFGHGFEVSSILDGSALQAEVFVRIHRVSCPLRRLTSLHTYTTELLAVYVKGS
jgi:hypothetical protein